MRGVWQVRKLAKRILDPDRPPSMHDPVAASLLEICSQRVPGLRPAYTYGVLRAAHTARALGIDRIWVAEMGVAAGGGLISLANVSHIVGLRYGVTIDAVGFDTGAGLPAPTDRRDAPFAFEFGDFAMKPEELRAKLPSNASIVLGDVAVTVADFVQSQTAPLGFVANDLDYYSSTVASLTPILTCDSSRLLPRVVMYFDDLIGYPYSLDNGEWAAIRDLNTAHPDRPISQIYGLRWHLGSRFDKEPWPELMFVLEARDHPQFNTSERQSKGALTLEN